MSTNFVAGLERRLLAILINHPGQVATASKKLRDDSFADARHQLIYDNLYALTQSSTDADQIDVADLLEALERSGLIGEVGGRDYILGLLQEPGTLQYKGLEALAEKVEENAVRRRAADVLKGGLGKLSDVTVDHDSAMSELQAQLREILTVANTEELRPVSQAADKLLEQLDTGIDPGTPTGLGKLDWYILGGFKPTQMITLAGNTGSGKTSLALQIALRAAQWAAEKPHERGPVLVFSFEMADTELLSRMVGQVIALQDGFHPPEGYSRRDRPKVREALEKLRNIAMRVEDNCDRTIEAVRAATERFIYANGILPSLVVVDHIGLMSAPNIKGGNRVAEVGHITSNLKRMAGQLKIPVLALAQLSRAVDKRDDHRPRLSDLRESGSIEHDSNIVLLIHKENYHEADLQIREQQDREGSAAQLLVAKNRAGSVGAIDLRWLGPRTLFYEPAFDDAGNELTIEGKPKGDGTLRPDLAPGSAGVAAATAATGGATGIDLSDLGDMFAVTPDEDELAGSEGPEPF